MGDEEEEKKLSLADEELLADLSYDELKQAFRLFDAEDEGFIRVATFRIILKEIDEAFSEEELDGIISDVSLSLNDSDGSGSIDFEGFVKIMNKYSINYKKRQNVKFTI